MRPVLIALGDEYRRNDGVGPAVARVIRQRGLPCDIVNPGSDPIALIDAWAGPRLAVIVDAVVAYPSKPGRIYELRDASLHDTTTGTHGFDLGAAIALGRALQQMPQQLVIVGVEIADAGHGRGLSPAVAAAVPAAARAVTALLAGPLVPADEGLRPQLP